MQNVMSKAWEIANEGRTKFGGTVKAYFAEALRIAWSIVKGAMDYAAQVKGILVKGAAGELVGSEKQIKWANEIRINASAAMIAEVKYEEYENVSLLPGGKSTIEKRPIGSLLNALRSEEGIRAHFDEMKAQGLPESRFVSTVESMNAALDRYARYTEVMSNTDAKFWIDNRNNQPKNYMFKAFQQYVSTGVKTF